MQVRILGTLEVLDDSGRPVAVVGPRQRAALALLALRAGHVIPADELVDVLWEEEPPANAANALQTVVSRLRRALGEHALETRPPGYVLQAQPDDVDAVRFERLADEGRRALAAGDVARAGERLGEALALWQGDPLAEFGDLEFARREAGRLRDRRLAALEDRVDADLAAGRHADVEAEIEALAAANPTRERLQAQRILALYRAGRQADALAAYRDVAGLLLDEYGIEPGRALRDLERQMLQQDPALDPPAAPAAPRVAPPPASPAREAATDRRVVSVACVELGELDGDADPEWRRAAHGRLLDAARAALERHGAVVEQLAGDALLAAFGLDQAHEDDAARAVRAAGAVAGAVEAAAVGVATGELLAGDGWAVGARVVRVARRLAAAAVTGQVLVDGETVLLAPHAAGYEQDGDAYRLVAAPPEHPLPRPLGTGAFVNRATELAAVRAGLDRAILERRAQVVTLLGSPGIGKSRLVHELAGSLGGDTVVVVGRCLSYGASTSVFALDEIVRALVGDDLERGLPALLEGVERGEQIAARVAAAIEAGGEGGPGEEVQWAFRRLLERVASEHLLVVGLDDLHWAEPWLLDLVEYLAAFASEPMLILTCGRPELLDRRPRWAGAEAPGELVRLEPLSEAHTDELVAGMLAGHGPPPGAAGRIARRSEGNPLFAEQVVALEVERAFAGGPGLPTSLRGLLQERIDSLTPDERDVLARAAVEGVTFHRGALAALAEDDEAAQERGAVMALMRKGFVTGARAEHPGEDAFRFRHALLRDAAYEALPKERRARLHIAYADWLEALDPQRHAMLGHHLRQAFTYAAEREVDEADRLALARRAAGHLFAAAEQALARSALPAATVLFRQTAALLPDEAPERVDALVELGAALLTEGRLEESSDVLADAEEQGRATGNERGREHAVVLGMQVALDRDPDPALAAITTVTERAATVFRSAGDDLGMSRVQHTRALAHWFAGRCADAGEAWTQAAAHARRSRHPWALQDMQAWVASSLQLGPEPVPSAIERCEALVEETASHPLWQAFIMRPLGLLYALDADLDRADAAFDACGRVLAELETIHSAAMHREGEAALLAGDPARAERLLRESVERLEAMGDRAFVSVALPLLAQAVEQQGRGDEAYELSLRSEEQASRFDILAQVHWRTVRARVLARREQHDEAERLARAALTLADSTDWLLGRGGARETLAAVLSAVGLDDEAYQARADAISLYERKGARLLAERPQPT